MQVQIQPIYVTQITGEHGSISKQRGKNAYSVKFYDYGFMGFKNGQLVRIEKMPETIQGQIMNQAKNLGWVN